MPGKDSVEIKSLERPSLHYLYLYNMDLSTVAKIAAVTSSGIFAGSTDSLIVPYELPVTNQLSHPKPSLDRAPWHLT
jgi:hypothetical protein